MDGICGILGRCDAGPVRAMLAAMAHRGSGTHVVEGKGFAVGSTSPISAGAPSLIDGTPRDAGGSAVAGDLLRESCNRLGHPEALKLVGSFAAALGLGEAWWLMRDRLGRKPLYYAQVEGGLVFASELKGVMASGLVARRLDLGSADRYLTWRGVPGPETLISGVQQVRPGHVVTYRDGAIEEVRFAGFSQEVEECTREKAAERLLKRLAASLEQHDVADVLWSSGIDCAALAAVRRKAGKEVRPLFVELKSVWQEEAWRTRESARMMGVEMEHVKAGHVGESEFRAVVRALEEPVADASVLPLWMIGHQAAGYGKAFLSGHGADELLGGYGRFRLMERARGAHRLVPADLLTRLLPSLPPNAFVRRYSKYLVSLRDNLQAYLSLLSVFDGDEREELYTEAMKAALDEMYGSERGLDVRLEGGDLTRSLLGLDLDVGIPGLLLAPCDRIMASHGIELHMPYLDDGMVDLAVSLPTNVRYGVRSKPVLRQAMRGALPGRIRLRARRGFKIPQSGPAVRALEGITRQTITRDRVEASGIFRWQHVEQVLRSASHNLYRRRQFWALLMFFGWYREYMEA